MFRIIFGAMMLLATLRFMARGWVELLYVQPKFFFHYWGFSWVQHPLALGLPAWTVHAVYMLMAAAALGILLGWRYRLSAGLFFLLFTYTELWDLTNYLNHYYFTSLVAGLMVLLPAHRSFSLDVRRRPSLAVATVPAWTIYLLQFQLGVVYFYAGLAKLHPDWLLHAQPLRLWLPARADMPLIGPLFKEVWVAYFFSWFGCLYDLSIPFLLRWHRSRPLAYVAVIAFHVLTWLLFPIGMFPWIMIGSTLIFFSARFHQRLLDKLQRLLRWRLPRVPGSTYRMRPLLQRALLMGLGLYVLVQLVFPFRYALYPGNLYWTEQGFRFSWRVMLMEKAGSISFWVEDSATGRRLPVNTREYLNAQQEKMMATQPDMILQFAHFLKEDYSRKGVNAPRVYADSWVSLNGRRSRPYLRSDVDLASLQDGWAPKDWILPFDDTPYRAHR
ncbi:Vitamin K-dependent gamma-carboxylase [Cesiribacter andamanensis AMV16]|uniref:Vitamin K-dependent gamma-carboxylase n=2 Tax=Cesiribacter TaxID=1133570 RepID=M7P0R8_9BACT|nr:Vitamin K-dependent gamma-carboxylase [Cesiribacter andamanensis AMV16]